MKILALDTAAASCSVALWCDGQIVADEVNEMTRGHASALLPMVETLLDQAGYKIPDLDGIAVTIGPGGFTGLRIGLSAARGFGVASKLPVMGVTTLQALNHGVVDRDCPVLCALDAKRADLYAQVFGEDKKPLCEPVAQLPEKLVDLLPEGTTRVLLAGDSFDRMEPILRDAGIESVNSDVTLPLARYVAEIAATRDWPADPQQSRPSALYIRPPDAELPKNGGRLRP